MLHGQRGESFREGSFSMRLVKAEWDRRALGVTSVVLSGDNSTEAGHLAIAISDLDEQMVTVRIPPGKGDLQDWLQKNGFVFREIQFIFQSPQEQSEKVRRLSKPEIIEGTESDIGTVLSWLEEGLILGDRISIDAMFGPQLSGRRFAQLLRDEIWSGASLKLVISKSKPVGWFCIRTLNKSPHIALSGVSPAASTPAAGLLLHKAMLDEVMLNYSDPLRSTVSSINLGALRAHQYFGYSIVKLEEVYVRLQF